VVVTWKQKHAGEAHPLLSHQSASGEPEQRILSPADQPATESSTVCDESAGGRVSFKHCSDLLEDFLKAISRMESEYLRAATEDHDTVSAVAARPKARTLNEAS
jgi:hypothetical protein